MLEELCIRPRSPAPAVLQVAFHEVERGRPFGPFLDATRGLLPEAPALEESSRREHVLEGFAALLRRSAEAYGLALLAVDDAHLADPSSSELLHIAARTSARAPLLTVLACRGAELEDNEELRRTLSALRRQLTVEEIRLEPLDATATRALIAVASPERVLDRVVHDSGGVYESIVLEHGSIVASSRAFSAARGCQRVTGFHVPGRDLPEQVTGFHVLGRALPGPGPPGRYATSGPGALCSIVCPRYLSAWCALEGS